MGVGVCAVGLLKGGYGKVCKVCPKSIKAPPLKSSRGSSTVPPLPSVVPVLRGRSAPRTAGRGRSRKQGIGTEPVPRQVGGSTPSFFSPPVGLYASPPGVSALHARPVVLPSRQSSPTGAPGACVPPLLRGEEEALLSRSGGGGAVLPGVVKVGGWSFQVVVVEEEESRMHFAGLLMGGVPLSLLYRHLRLRLHLLLLVLHLHVLHLHLLPPLPPLPPLLSLGV